MTLSMLWLLLAHVVCVASLLHSTLLQKCTCGKVCCPTQFTLTCTSIWWSVVMLTRWGGWWPSCHLHTKPGKWRLRDASVQCQNNGWNTCSFGTAACQMPLRLSLLPYDRRAISSTRLHNQQSAGLIVVSQLSQSCPCPSLVGAFTRRKSISNISKKLQNSSMIWISAKLQMLPCFNGRLLYNIVMTSVVCCPWASVHFCQVWTVIYISHKLFISWAVRTAWSKRTSWQKQPVRGVECWCVYAGFLCSYMTQLYVQHCSQLMNNSVWCCWLKACMQHICTFNK